MGPSGRRGALPTPPPKKTKKQQTKKDWKNLKLNKNVDKLLHGTCGHDAGRKGISVKLLQSAS